MPVPDKVLQLIENFERNIGAYKNQSYNETQLRRERRYANLEVCQRRKRS